MAVQTRKKILTSRTNQFLRIQALRTLKTAMDDSTISAFSWRISGATGRNPRQYRILSFQKALQKVRFLLELTYTIVSTSLSMNDILSSLTDPSLQSLRKSLETRQSSTSKSAGQKLSAPLAKNLQKKLERQAAYEETKAEITKWQPIVKANREVPPTSTKINR